MSSDVSAILQLDKKGECKVIVVKEINNCDSTFIINCVLNTYIRNKTAFLLVSTHNSLMHYQQVGLKMNYNLQKQLDFGLMAFYNLGEKIIDDLSNDQCSLQQHFLNIKENVVKMLDSHKTVNIILDGISHLFDLNYTLNDVNMFCNNVTNLSRSINDSFVIFHCNIAFDNDISYLMANLLSHKAHTILEVENLPSGWSADVSGCLVVKYSGYKFQDDHMVNLTQNSSKYLFKLFDRGVKLLAPGTV